MQYVHSKIVVTIIILLFAGISLHAATSELPEAEGRRKAIQWIIADDHNQYGRKIELATREELTLYLNRMDPIAKIFQEHLAGALYNNAEFRTSSYLFSRAHTPKVRWWPTLLSQGLDVTVSGLGILLVYNSSMSDTSARAASYTVCGVGLAKSIGFFTHTLWQACASQCSRPFPDPDDLRTEADKIALYLTFQAYGHILARREHIAILTGEYVNRVLGALSINYTKDSRESLVTTILRSIT